MVRAADGPAAKIEAMVAAAEATLGMSDENNTKRTPIHDWYNAKFGNPDPGKFAWDWCDGAVTYWAWKSGNEDAVVFGGAYAYTVAHAQKFQAKGQWHTDTDGIRRGDIVFFDWNLTNSVGAIDHVELVTGVRPDGTVDTIGGNFENKVGRWTRHADTIVGYGRPAYGGGSTVPPDGEDDDVATLVKLADAQAHTAAATKVIQDALNKEYGGVLVDGDYGPKTTAAYKRWQQSLGWPGDGQPSQHSLWSLSKKYNFSTDITGTPAGPGGTTPTTPPPVTPTPTGDKVTIEAVYPGAPVSESVKIVQAALNEEYGGVTVDGDFGDQTVAAYSRWQKSLGFTGTDANGTPGETSLSRLAAKHGFTLVHQASVPSTPGTGGTSVDDYLTLPEPAHNYARVTYGGRTVNVRTREMLRQAGTWAGVTITLTQGSYNKGVSASAGTHDGGGVVDINVGNWSGSMRSRVVLALRKAGFAAWLRTPAQGFAYHIHACAIGDREMAGGAKNQVQSYFNGRNGLANNGLDDAERRWPNWADKYNQ